LAAGFGSKIFCYADETMVCWAASRVGRPIKWTAERSESFQTDCHGRDHVTHAELALDKDGKFLALKVETIANMGAYLSTFSTAVPTYLYATLLAGQYTTPLIYANVKAALTHTAPVDAYRGAGRPEATFVIESIVSKAAAEMKIDAAELRRKNFIPTTAFPYQTPVALQYDSGNYPPIIDEAMKMADYKGFEARRAEAKSRGKLRGIGFSSYIEACGLAPSQVIGQLGGGVGQWESAQIKFNPTGNVQILTGAHSHGQGHETTFAQLIHDKLGVPMDQIEVVHGDTRDDAVRHGQLWFAVAGCRRLGDHEGRRQGHRQGQEDRRPSHGGVGCRRRIRERRLQGRRHRQERATGPGDLRGLCAAQLSDRRSRAGHGRERLLRSVELRLPVRQRRSAKSEIDPDTGTVEIVNHTAVEDFGTIVNPLIVDGPGAWRHRQGVGQALMENAVYDKETGQLDERLVHGLHHAARRQRAVVQARQQGSRLARTIRWREGCGEAGAIDAPAPPS
jgi:carbon-monoxide dehydrogenase large subunit